MDQRPLLEFPCEFPIKVIARGETDLRALVTDIVSQHLDEDRFKRLESKTGRYQSLTVTISAHSREQLDRIYEALTAHQDIVMAL